MKVEGSCYALFAYDGGFSIDLDSVEKRVSAHRKRLRIPQKGHAPLSEGDLPTPLQLTQEGPALDLGPVCTNGRVTAVLYEYGAICVTYTIPLNGELEQLVELSDLLYDNAQLKDDARKRVGELLRAIEGAVEKPGIASRARDLQRIARLQADNALLFEGVHNAYKMHGDQYLARLYRTASQRFHLDDWDRSIDRKLQTLESIYSKLTDQAANRRIEALEWIIIVLIAIEVLSLFFPKFLGL